MRDLSGRDELPDELDPYSCPACLAAGDACDFHEGFGLGWDACVAFIAQRIDADEEVA